MPSFASCLSIVCRLALPALLVGPCVAGTGNADAGDARLATSLPKVRAFLTTVDDPHQAPRPEHATGSTANPQRLVFTMHADVSPQTSMLFERSRTPQIGAPATARFDAAPATRVGFEFRPVSAANALRPIGALRVQLSDTSTLSLRPRRGGVLVSWRSQF